MKFSVDEDYRVPTVVRHQGVVIVLALDENQEIYYRVLALDPAQPDDDKGWGSRRKIAFPDQLRPAGMSLVTVDLNTAERTAGAPFQAVSDGKHVYLFRQSSDSTLYVDRFVFDPTSQMLNPAWEARFQRSRKRDVPASRKDTLGARDMEGEPFFEPTTELTVVNDLRDGRFCVLLMPGRLPSEWRWQIFATNSNGEIDSFSIARGEDGLFDMADVQQGRIKWAKPGRRFQAGPAALFYMQQEKAQDEYGRTQQLKRAARVMLAVPAGRSKQAGDPQDKGVAYPITILDFGVSRAGTLAVIDDQDSASEVTLARGDDKDGLLPVPILEVGDTEVPIPMRTVAVDGKGLTVSAGLLRFARSGDTPFLLDGADGLIHLYFRGDGGQFLVAQYDTLTARAEYILPLDAGGATQDRPRLHFTARRPGTQMQDHKIRIAGSSGQTCRVTIEGRGGVKEVWRNVPRDLEMFLAVLNGTATSDGDDPLVAEGEVVYYSYGRHVQRKGVPNLASADNAFFGSTLFSVGVDNAPEGDAPVRVGNVRASQVQAWSGQDNAWKPEPQGKALLFDGSGDYVELPDDKLAVTGDLTMEAWVNVEASAGAHDSLRIVDYHLSEDSRCTLGLTREGEGNGDDGEALYKVFAGVWNQAAQTKDAPVSSGEWTHLAAVYNATRALRLRGRGYVDCGNDVTLDMTEAMTVEAWVTLAASPPEEPQVILSKWGAAAEEQSWRLYVDTDGKPCFETLDQNRRVTRVKSGKKLEADRAYHLAGVFAASPKEEEEVALNLSGTSDHVRIPSADTINFGTDDDFTVAAWIKPEQKQAYTKHKDNDVIEKWSGSHGYPYVIRYLNQTHPTNSGKIVAARFDGYHTKNNPSICSRTRIDDGVFHHVAFVKRGKQLALYIDGLEEATAKDTTKAATTNNSPLFIGARGGKINFFSGQINNVRIWSRPLSPDEIGKDMDTPASQVVDAVGNWAFDRVDDYVQKAQDRSGRGNEGTLIGCAFDDVDKCEYEQQIYVDGQLRGWGLIATDRYMGWLVQQSGQTISLETRPHFPAPDSGDVLLLQDRQVLAKEVTVVIPETEPEETIELLPTVEVAAATINGIAGQHPGLTSVYRLKRAANTVQSTATGVNIGRSASEEGYFQGTIDDVRVWKVSRRAWQIQRYHDQTQFGDAEGLVSHWRFEEAGGETAIDSKGSNHGSVIHPETELIPEMWTPSARSAALSLYVNGERVDLPDPLDVVFGDLQFSLGAMLADGTAQQHMAGIIDELRLWNSVRTREQIRDSMYRSLSGEEEDLAGYWPLDEGEGGAIRDLTGNGQDGSLAGPRWIDSTAPIGNEGPEVRNVYGGLAKPDFNQLIAGPPAAVEYGDMQWDDEGNLFGVMKRCYVFRNDAVQLVTGFKVGDLELNFVGQVQTAPTLIGYIEGAPPVPSENLTLNDPVSDDYVGASAIELTEAKETTQVYSSSRDTGFDMSVEFKAGLHWAAGMFAGLGVESKVFSSEGKVGVHGYFEHSMSHLSAASRTVGTSKTLTKSLTLAGGWEERQDHDQNGQLRYLNPEVGRRYVPNNMGYALVKSGTADLFALRLKRTGSLVAYQLLPNPDIPEDWNIIMFPLNPRYVKNGTLDGMVGLVADRDARERGSYFKPLEAYALKEQVEREAKQIEGYYNSFAKKARPWTAAGGPESELPGAELGYDWETGRDKRSMANTYVWTADGGFYAEQEQFSSIRQESLGSAYHFLGQGGVYADVKLAAPVGFFFELDAMFGGHINTTISKSEEEKAAFGLHVDVQGEGSLNKWEGDPGRQQGQPAAEPCPGKVDAYRFMTFYLAPKPENFDKFYDEVVDPEWLNGQGRYAGEYGPNARALRAARSKPNELWRVMHRVTYVSRIPPEYERTPVEAVPKDVRRPTNIVANNGLIQEIEGLMSPKPKESKLVILGRAADRLLVGKGGDGQGKLADTVPCWADVSAEIKKEIRRDVVAYLRGYFVEETEDESDPVRPVWELTVEYREGAEIIAGSFPYPGIELTVADPWGNATTVTTGSKPEHGPGGFEVLAGHPAIYTLTFLDQRFEVEKKKGVTFVTLTETGAPGS